MPLQSPNLPPEMLGAFALGVWKFFDEPADPLLLIVTGVIPCLHHWQKISGLGLDAIAEGAGAAGIKPEGWRFVAGRPEGRAIAAEVVPVKKGIWSVANVTTGPGVHEILKAAAEMESLIESLPEVGDRNYEVQVLRVLGLLTESFLVKLFPAGTLLVIPYQTQLEELTVKRPYSVDEFLTILKPLAEERLKFKEEKGIMQRRPKSTKKKSAKRRPKSR